MTRRIHQLSRRLLPLLALGVASCSRLQSATDLGAEVVNSVDPRIADFNANYRQAPVDIPVVGSISLRETVGDSADSVPDAVHTVSAATGITAGVWGGDTAIPYCGFDTLYTFSNKNTYAVTRLTMHFVLDTSTVFAGPAMRFVVRRMQTSKSRTSILSRSAADEILDTLCFLASDTADSDRVCRDSIVLADTRFDHDPKRRHCTVRFADTTVLDTAYIRDTTGGPIRDSMVITPRDTVVPVVTSCVTVVGVALTDPMYLYLTPLDTGLCRIKIPAIAVHDSIFTVNPGNDTIRQAHVDSIYCVSADVSVFESDSAGRDSLPLSSWASGRHAVATLNLAPFWSAMGDSTSPGQPSFTTVQSAVLVVAGTAYTLESADTTDSIAVYYSLTANAPAAGSRIGYQRLGHLPQSASDTLMIDLRRDMLRLVQEGRPATAYLNLRAELQAKAGAGRWAQVRWGLAPGGTVRIHSAFSFPR